MAGQASCVPRFVIRLVTPLPPETQERVRPKGRARFVWERDSIGNRTLIQYNGYMISLQALHEMPLKEKLFVMEALWDDISTAEVDLSVPPWQ